MYCHEHICITAHFIDEKWHPQKRIVKFTAIETPHTGVVIINTMVKLMKTHLINKKMLFCCGRLFRQRCAAHVINLICQAGLDYLSPMISKIHVTVKYIRSSSARKEKFEEIISQLAISCEETPCLDVCTHWNSTFMLATAKEFRLVFDSLSIQDPNYTFKPSFEE